MAKSIDSAVSGRRKTNRRPKAADLNRKVPNQDRAKKTVEKILAAASATLSTSGLDRLTMRQIAATAGVSVGLAYDYFPTKQAVLYRVYESRLKERLDFFDEAFAPENALSTFAKSFDRYIQRQRAAGFPSRLDLELQNAIERDEELARLTRHYEDELSHRYVDILHRYGSAWTEGRLLQLAKFAHSIDHVNLKLQRQARPGNRGFYNELTTELFYFLVEHCGADTGRYYGATMTNEPSSNRDYVAEWEARCLEIESLEFPPTFRELIDNAAAEFGERTAIRLIDVDRSLSFTELRELVRRLASALYDAGVRKGTRVAVLLPNGIEYPVSWLAIATLGAVIVPTNTAYTGAELDYVFNDAGVEYLIVDGALLDGFKTMESRPHALRNDHVFVAGSGYSTPFVSFADLLTNGEAAFQSPEGLSSDDLLNIQYSSGTTGFPKGCMQHQRYWLVLGGTVAAMSPGVTSLLTDHPYFYMDPQWQLVWALSSGATVNVAPRMSSSKFWQRVRDYNIDWAWFPTPILGFPEVPGEDQHSILKFHAGAISKASVLTAERRFGVNVRGTYGMTEIGAGTLVPDDIPDTSILETVGLRAPFRELRVVDDNGNDVPNGTPGELVVRGDGVFLGYYNNPEANENGFYGDWFRTGDMFIQDERGYYKIVGRFKDMIRRSSENISALEVEHTIMQLAEVVEAAAVPVKDDYRGEEVKVYLLLSEGETPESCTPQDVAEHCVKRLAKFKIPRYYAYVDTDFPRTPSNKVAKHRLTEGVSDLREGSFDRVDEVWR